MKKLHFRYEMELKMDRPVVNHYFRIRCRPMETGRQHCEDFSCRIDPDVLLNEVYDGFGNHGYAGVIWEPHDWLHMSAEGIVYIHDTLDCEFHPMYRFPSVYTKPDEKFKIFLQETELEIGRPVRGQEELCILMDRLYGRFSYVAGVTNVKTTAAESFAGGQGVCQDYAHIFISLCRLAGVPARYVAGFMLGEGKTHAWVEVWDGAAWRGYDPTHNCLTDESYIKLTHGRDFEDGAVDKGCFFGFAFQTQQIYVKVEEVY